MKTQKRTLITSMLILASLIASGCSEKNVSKNEMTKNSNESFEKKIDDAFTVVKIKLAAQKISDTPVVLSSNGCYWAIGESNNKSNVVALKITNSDGKQLCGPLDIPAETSVCPSSVMTTKIACPSGVGEYQKTVQTSVVNGQCSSATTDNLSSCSAVDAKK